MQKKKYVAWILVTFFVVILGCVSKEAVKMDVQGIRNDMGTLEGIVDQKADSSVVTEQIGELHNEIKQTTQVAETLLEWKKVIQAKNITYSGGGWIVLGTGVISFIFVGAGVLLIRAFMKRGNLLTLLTCTMQKVVKDRPHVREAISDQLDKEVNNGGKFHKQDKEALAQFCRKVGTFFKNV